MSVRTVTEQELEEQRIYTQKIRSVLHIYDKKPLAYVHSYGCQQNVTDGEKIKGMHCEISCSHSFHLPFPGTEQTPKPTCPTP